MSIYDTLNPMQREAVYHTDGPLLILAGAGSGKTRVLTHRIAYLIEEAGVNPWNILAITFTNKAADEMRERVDRLVGFGAESIWVATFHSTCVRILRRHIDALGYDNHFTIYDTDDQKTVMKQVIKTLDLDPKLYKERAMITAISSAKNEMISPDEMEMNAGLNFHEKQVAKVYREYERVLRANNALDFDDLLLKTVELFREHPEVLDYYQNRFRYILVDEYQDTNSVQFQFIELLAHKYQNLCVVGDDDQSIYRFRGADITNILSFEEHFPKAKVIKLEQNYRSTAPILNTANEIIANNRGRKEKRLWTEKTNGDPVQFRLFNSGYEEAETIVKEVRDLERRGKLKLSDVAVLYRTNAQSRSFEEKCVQYNVPYRLIGGVNFYQRAEIKDILAYLKTINNGQDDLAVHRILNVPKRGIGQATADKVQMFASEHGMNFYDALRAASQIPGIERAKSKLRKFTDQIDGFRFDARDMTPDDLIRRVIEEIDYSSTFDELDEEKAQQKRENLEELVNKAADFTKNYEAQDADADERSILSAFLEDVALVADIDSLDSAQDRIVLMTLHGAKGLEFPRVYLTGMEDGIFPSYLSIGSGDTADLEEERRLCYVGITRAMEHLTLTAAKQRTVRGEPQSNQISRFIKEIPDHLVDKSEAYVEKKFYGARNDRSGYDRGYRDLDDDYGDRYGGFGDGFSSGSDSYSSYGGKSSGFGGGFSSGTDSYSGYGSYGGRSSGFGGGFGNGFSPAKSDTMFDTPGRTSARGYQGAGSGRSAKAAKPAKSYGRGTDALAAAGIRKGSDLKNSGGPAIHFSDGDRVHHAKFGDGTVLHSEPRGRNIAISVLFDNETFGKRVLVAGSANLQKI